MNKLCLIALSVVLMLSACGEQSKIESVVAKVPSAIDEATLPIEVMQAPVEGMAAEKSVTVETANAPIPAKRENRVAKEAQAVIQKPITVQSGSLSREEGLALASKSGCLNCHKIEARLIGPAWVDVAKRYRDFAEGKTKLMSSVKSGSKGKWTEETGGIPMRTNSPKVSDEDIDKLVGFILSL